MTCCTQCGGQVSLVERYQRGDGERFILQCSECHHAFVTDIFSKDLGSLEDVAPERVEQLVAAGLMMPLQAARQWPPPD